MSVGDLMLRLLPLLLLLSATPAIAAPPKVQTRLTRAISPGCPKGPLG